MARYTCERCKEMCNTMDAPHLCKDLKKRTERNTKAVNLVKEVLNKYKLTETYFGEFTLPDAKMEEIAAEIVKALAGRDLGVE